MYCMDDRGGDGPLIVRYPYRSQELIIENADGEGSYAAPDASLKASRTVCFAHSLSAIFSAAISAGFSVRNFEELDRVPWDARLPRLTKTDDFYWSLPKDAPFFPLSFALQAELLSPIHHGRP